MQQFKKILVYVNTELRKHPALHRAAVLAELSGGQLKALDVVGELPATLRLPAYGYPALADTLLKEKQRRLERLTKPLRQRGIRVKTEAQYGKAALEIIREVLRGRYDLVMKTAEPGGLTKLFGTTAMRLLRECPCPVWLVKAAHDRRYTRVLAAVDPSSPHDEKNALNTKIMDLALAVAKLEGAELHVVHAWHLFGASVLSGEAGVPRDLLERYSAAVRKETNANLDQFLATLKAKIPKNRVHLVEGDPAVVIRDFAGREKVDLIVMGTVVRTGVAAMLIGNTAERVLAQVNCSILAVKPDRFVCPVTREK